MLNSVEFRRNLERFGGLHPDSSGLIRPVCGFTTLVYFYIRNNETKLTQKYTFQSSSIATWR